MLSMAGSWNWSSTSMNGFNAKEPEQLAWLLCHSAALDAGNDAECVEALAGSHYSSFLGLSSGPTHQPRSIRFEAWCGESVDSWRLALPMPDPFVAVEDTNLRRPNQLAGQQRAVGRHTSPLMPDLASGIVARRLEFSSRQDVSRDMSTIIVTRSCHDQFTLGSHRHDLSSIGPPRNRSQETRIIGRKLKQ